MAYAKLNFRHILYTMEERDKWVMRYHDLKLYLRKLPFRERKRYKRELIWITSYIKYYNRLLKDMRRTLMTPSVPQMLFSYFY